MKKKKEKKCEYVYAFYDVNADPKYIPPNARKCTTYLWSWSFSKKCIASLT